MSIGPRLRYPSNIIRRYNSSLVIYIINLPKLPACHSKTPKGAKNLPPCQERDASLLLCCFFAPLRSQLELTNHAPFKRSRFWRTICVDRGSGCLESARVDRAGSFLASFCSWYTAVGCTCVVSRGCSVDQDLQGSLASVDFYGIDKQ